MYCTRCGDPIEDTARFCPQCGNQTMNAAPAGPPPLPVARQVLMLDKRRKKVAGVCAGFARYMDADITLVRLLWLVIAICTGVGFIAYLAAWIILPSDADMMLRDDMPQRV